MTDVFSLEGRRIWVAGHTGFVGSAICRRLQSEDCETLTVPRSEVDLRRQAETEEWMAAHRPDAIIVAAATVGGIHFNATHPAEFIYDNLAIETNIIHTAHTIGVKKLLFLGSSCIYPRMAPQPITEDSLLGGPLEITNQAYAIAKIAGIELCRSYRQQYGCDFISAMPTNLYGTNDNFDLETSHVVPALIAKAHAAKLSGAPHMVVWGSGRQRRELLYVDDLADAVVLLLRAYSGDTHVNVGTGEEVTVKDLAQLVCDVVGFRGALAFDSSKPDGTPRKRLDVSRLRELGWTAGTPLREGLARTYEFYQSNVAEAA